MSVQDRVREEEAAVLALIREAGETVPIEGDRAGWADVQPGGRGIRLPTPSELVRDGRRARARRRIVVGTAGLAACVLVAAGGVAVGAGQLRLPGLDRRADGVQPATLEASRQAKVREVTGAIDQRFGSTGGLGLYRTGPADPDAPPLTLTYDEGDVPDEARLMADLEGRLTVAGVDRVVSLADPKPGADPEAYTFRLSHTRPGTTEKLDSRTLGTLTLGADRRGRWLQARPGPEDGWLIFGVLPSDAFGIQLRVAGTDALLPVPADGDAPCTQVTRTTDGEVASSDGTTTLCTHTFPGRLVQLRIATSSDEPPIDAISYVDESSRAVVLGQDDGQTVDLAGD